LRIPAHVSAERRADLFHEFERLDRNVNNNVEGTGSGLAISVRLAALMGGYLGHADNPAGGNVFWLELPLVAGTADEAKNGMPAPSSVDLLKTAHTDTAAQTAAASLAARVHCASADARRGFGCCDRGLRRRRCGHAFC
jgi:hypothetical protein